MLFYLSKRIASSAAVLLVVSILTFLILMWIPGDPAHIVLGIDANPKQLQELREAMGLTKPWYEQYSSWLINFSKGDWGKSQVYGAPVKELVMQRLPVTFSLAVLAMLIAALISLVLGILSAIKKNTWIDYLSRVSIQFGLAVPPFWIAMILIIIFAVRLRWLPASGYQPVSVGIIPWIKSIILPSVVLAIGEIGILVRIIRSSMLTSLGEDYMDMARAKGLPFRLAYIKYALRSAMIAPITVMGIQLAKLLGGTVIVESIFSMPGIGRLILTAVEQRDIVLLQGLVLFVTFTVIIINLLVDILYMIIDPRIKSTKEGV